MNNNFKANKNNNHRSKKTNYHLDKKKLQKKIKQII